MALLRPRMISYAQPFDRVRINRLNAQKLRKRRTLLPREWASNGWDYIGDSWRVWGHRLIQLKGKRFWNLLVLRRDRTRGSRAYAYWICQCDCGRRYSIRSDRLRDGTVVCCRECSRKVNQIYKRMRDEARTARQLIHGAKVNKLKAERLRIIRLQSIENGDTIHIKKVLTEAEIILQMRDEIGLKISDIAKEMNMTPEAVRLTLLDIRSSLSNREKEHVRAATILPDLVVEGQKTAQVNSSEPMIIPIKKSRFTISDTASDGGLTPKQLREYMNSQIKD